MVKLSSGIELNPNELTSEDREAIVKALEGTKGEVWTPEYNDLYYAIDSGSVESLCWRDDTTDRGFLSIGGVFDSYGAAEKHLTYLKALQVLRGDTKGYEWKLGNEYVCVYYNNHTHTLATTTLDGYAYIEPIKFASHEDAETSIAVHEKEWRIVLEVE